MKRIIALLLVLALMLGALTGCGGKKNNEGEGSGQGQSQEQDDKEGGESDQPEGGGEGSDQEGQDDGGEELPADRDLRSESYAELMSGHWDYIDPYSNAPTLQFNFSSDGTYTATRRSGISAKYLNYEGKWAAAEVPVAGQYSSVMLPMLSLSLEKTDDESMSSFSSLGEFIIDAKALCDGHYVVYIVQYNNGDSILSMAYNIYSAVLTRTDDAYVPEPSDSVKKSARAAGLCWKLDADSEGAKLWIDDRDYDSAQPTGKEEAVAYRFAEDAKIYMESDYILGGELVEFETDENGDITAIGPLIRGYEDPDDLESDIAYFIEDRELDFANEEGDLTVARSTFQLISAEDDSYPELSKAFEAYNAEIAEYAQQMGEQLVEGVEGMEPEHLKELVPLVSDIRIEVHRSDEKIFSFVQSHYYDGGGPHPYQQYDFVNIDPVSGKVLTADDIITDRDKFMRLITDEIKKNWEYVEQLPDEIGELLVEKDGITVLYNTYELGSYAAGNQEMFFDLQTLEGMVNMELFE